MKKKIFYRRAFLNKEGYHELGGIVCDIEDVRDKKWGDTAFYTNLKITDCENQISLAVDVDNEEEFENTLFKLNTLIDTISSFRDSIIPLKKDITEHLEKIKEEKNGDTI